ncbi:hypothetical protein V8E53_014093, partial [Lactarius tabidus]
IYGLREHLAHLIDHHVAHVKQWLKLNTNHFQAKNASMEELSQAFSSAVISLRANVQLRNVPSPARSRGYKYTWSPAVAPGSLQPTKSTDQAELNSCDNMVDDSMLVQETWRSFGQPNIPLSSLSHC